MFTVTTVQLDGKAYVILARDEYERLASLARLSELPPLPNPDSHGDYPAVPYARATIARGIIRDRLAAGLTQRELARLAAVRVETLCRIENGRQTPSVATIEKIDRALQRAKPRRGK